MLVVTPGRWRCRQVASASAVQRRHAPRQAGSPPRVAVRLPAVCKVEGKGASLPKPRNKAVWGACGSGMARVGWWGGGGG